MKIRVLIADDHKFLAESLSSSLNTNDNFEVVNICHNSQDTLWNIQLNRPDVLLLDLNMPLVNSDLPRASGFEVLEELKKKNDVIKTIVVSSYNDYTFIRQALNLGARGYLLKNTTIDEIAEAITTVYGGKTYIQKEVEKSLKNKQNSADSDCSGFVASNSLTKREKEVLIYISKGFRTEDIALALNLKKYTIDEYRDNLIHKMNAKNSAELVRIAFENGLL
jgi:NarL family two-component system response regulator YdfI